MRDRMRRRTSAISIRPLKQRTINEAEADQLKAAADAVAAAVAVDDFAPEEFTARGAANKEDVSSQAISQQATPPQPQAAE